VVGRGHSFHSASYQPFTFAVIGRNEARTLGAVVGQALEAARDGDRVWFVDSASEDDSVAVARRLGVDVILGPQGKGRAMAAALDRCREGYICFVDADLFEWSTNIPSALRAAAVRTGADMVVGSFDSDRRRGLTPRLYWPLVDALFPDCGRRVGPVPISGLRVFDATFPTGPLPPGYGVETHLNLAFGTAKRQIASVQLGYLRGPLRGYSNVEECGLAILEAVLDFAVADGRLDSDGRARWDRWARSRLEEIVAGYEVIN
jgi:glucosyl-3-phosphoglycerate synthase